MQVQKEAEIKAIIENKRRSSDASNLSKPSPVKSQSGSIDLTPISPPKEYVAPSSIHPIKRRSSMDADVQQAAQAVAETQRKLKLEQVCDITNNKIYKITKKTK